MFSNRSRSSTGVNLSPDLTVPAAIAALGNMGSNFQLPVSVIDDVINSLNAAVFDGWQASMDALAQGIDTSLAADIVVGSVVACGPTIFRPWAQKILLFASTGAGHRMMDNLTREFAGPEEEAAFNIIQNGITTAYRQVVNTTPPVPLKQYVNAIAACTNYAETLKRYLFSRMGGCGTNAEREAMFRTVASFEAYSVKGVQLLATYIYLTWLIGELRAIFQSGDAGRPALVAALRARINQGKLQIGGGLRTVNVVVAVDCSVGGGAPGTHNIPVPVVIFAPSFPGLLAQLPAAMRTPLIEFGLTAMIVHEREYIKAVQAGRIPSGLQFAGGKGAYHGIIAHYQKNGADAVKAAALLLADSVANGNFVAAHCANCAWDRKASAGNVDLHADTLLTLDTTHDLAFTNAAAQA